MSQELPYIRVSPAEFASLRHDDFDAAIRAKLVACLRTTQRPQRRHKRPAKPSWKAAPRPGRRPLNPTAAYCPRLEAQGLCNKISPLNMPLVKKKLLELAETEADLVAEVVLTNAQTNPYYLELLVQVLGGMLPAIVSAHLERMTSRFVEERGHMLVDDLAQDDYDAFCAFLANKRTARARYLCIMDLGDLRRLDHTVEEMLDAMGAVDGRHCKDLMIDLLQEYCKRCPGARRNVCVRCTAYLRDPVAAGLDSKTRFKLMDMVVLLAK
jgi:hypothetical protein